MNAKLVTCIVLLVSASAIGCAQKPQPVDLYADGIPNSKSAPADYSETNDKGWLTKVTQPTLTPYFPDKSKATGAAILVIPGGGYAGLSFEHEGHSIAEKFNELGVTAFVLKYRLPDDRIMVNRSIGPLQDAQRALQLMRQRAGEWNIDPNRCGVIGFSAGGHLASTLGTHFGTAVIDNKANTNLRPDFMILMYPVISFGKLTHQGSKEALVGKEALPAQVNLYSNETQVTSDTPPALLIHAGDDNVVPVQNALVFYEALLRAGVKGVEMHIYPLGGHGFGLNNPTTKDDLFQICKNWMDANGWLNK